MLAISLVATLGLFYVTETAEAGTVIGQLINVDIQSSGNPAMSGGIPEGAATGATGDAWNLYNVPVYPASGLVAALPLQDSSGAGTTATFQITDAVSAVCCAPSSLNVTTDGSLVHATLAPTFHNWEILGLTPSGTYEMYMYSLNVAGRSIDVDIDLNGDGVLAGAGELGTNIPGSNTALLFPSITASGTGRVFGVWRLGAGATEGNPSGFQIRDITVPEPSTLLLAAMGLLGLLAFGRRRK